MAIDFPKGKKNKHRNFSDSDSNDEALIDRADQDERENEKASSHQGHDGDGDEESADHASLTLPGSPLVLNRDQHNISRKRIDPEALKVLYRLQRNDYRAFLVGGGVRDLLLGKKPKDFDVSTDASPEAVRALFRNSRIIGRRFRINHVYFHGNKIIEVSTFRAHGGNDSDESAAPGMADNTYGDPLTDAFRRDLTINGLFYDASTFSVIDYVGGIQDLRDGVIRIIGDPEVRFHEDPVRMIRAIRHAARTGFVIEPATYSAICNFRTLIKLCPKARVYEEFVRDLRGGHSLDAFRLFEATGLLAFLMPALATAIAEDIQAVWGRLEKVLSEIDYEIKSGNELSTAVLFAAVMMGNFPKVLFGSDAEFSEIEDIRKYWEISPQEQNSTDDAEDAPRTGPSHRKQKVRRFTSEVLAEAIAEVFKPLGVSRKDRESMEQILMVRYALIEGYFSSSGTAPTHNRELLKDALALLRVTALDDVSRNALEYWAVEENQSSNHQSRNKRRQKRPRRRKRTR